MIKQIISSALALGIVFGTAAAPYGALQQDMITVSAADNEVTPLDLSVGAYLIRSDGSRQLLQTYTVINYETNDSDIYKYVSPYKVSEYDKEFEVPGIEKGDKVSLIFKQDQLDESLQMSINANVAVSMRTSKYANHGIGFSVINKSGTISQKNGEVIIDVIDLDAYSDSIENGTTYVTFSINFPEITISEYVPSSANGNDPYSHQVVSTGGGGYENISNDLSKATVTGIKNKVYTGKAQTQDITVRSGSYTLNKDYEYSVTYKNNTKVGTASVIIEGKGYFAGQTITKTFKITGKSLTKANVSGISNKVYTGKAIKPAPVVKLGGKTLKKGVDYTVSYKNNKKVGKATVTIKGKGAYTGTITKTFKINPKKTTIKKATSPKTRQLKVSYGKVKGVTGYQVKYSTSKKFTKKTTKTVTVKGAGKTSKTIKKLKKGKTYYVKVRSYKTVNGVKYYGAYSAVKKVKVK